jgi:hypothetical protein
VVSLSWFHGHRHDAVADITKVLRNGVRAADRTEGGTGQLELELAIQPIRAYCYLGRTHEVFGSFAFAVSSVTSVGDISPFDTGGLVRHVNPIKTWEAELRKKFLADYSWPLSELEGVLSAYPGATNADLVRYLDRSAKPMHSGPHKLWTGKSEADIWALNEDWRVWTWEGRFHEGFAVGDQLVAWTCPTARYGQLMQWADNVANAADQEWFATVLPKWVEGGVYALVEHVNNGRVAA